MTSEEIEQTLQLVVRNQTRLSEAQIRFEARQTQLDEVIKQVASSYQSLIESLSVKEERSDGHGRWRGAPDERLTAPVNAQVKYEVRQERLEEAFSQVAESQLIIVQLASVHGERLDAHDKANLQTENRLAALIDAQIQLSHCVEALTSNISTLNGCIDMIGAHLDQAAEQIKALATAQTRTDEQIKLLLGRDVPAKPGRKSTKTAKKERPGDQQTDSTSLENNQPGEPA
jgi:hypothetical protein